MAYFLTKSGFDVELIIVSNIDLLREKAIEVYNRDRLETFIVFGTDSELYELSRLSFSPDQRKHILPAQNADATRIVGSKVGLYEYLKQLGIPHPRTEIVLDLVGLTQISSHLNFPIFVKADVNISSTTFTNGGSF
jgi:hypothetical protein